MKHNTISRREAIKVLGTLGISPLASKFINKISPQAIQSPHHTNPNIIILLFDTLTARHLSLHNYKRNTTPNMVSFATQSTVFHQHHSASSHTNPNTTSLLTGTYPWSHRALGFYTPVLDAYKERNIFHAISKSHHSIAYTHNTQALQSLHSFSSSIDILKPIEELTQYNPNALARLFKNDYPIGFYAMKRWRDSYMGISNSLFINSLQLIDYKKETDKINAEYNKLYPLGLSVSQEGHLFKLEDAIDWIGKQVISGTQPFIGYFHLLPPHEIYRPRSDTLGKFQNDNLQVIEKPRHFFSGDTSQDRLNTLGQLYDEYILLVDAEFGRFINMLREGNVLDNSYIILTSDHGQLFERGIHGHDTQTLFESISHIPLIIRSPYQKKGVNIFTPTSIIDLMPTVLHLAGAPQPDWHEGQLLPTLGGSENRGRAIFCMDGKANHRLKPIKIGTFSAIRWPYKLIHYSGYTGYDDVDELYNIENDPEELHNIAKENPSIVFTLKEELLSKKADAEDRALNQNN